MSKLDISEIPELKISKAPRDEDKAKLLCDFIVIDVETTGLCPKKNKLLEISAVGFEEFEPVEYMTTLIKPTNDIPTSAAKINGITNDMVRNSP